MKTSTFYSSAFTSALAALIVACGGGGGDSYGGDGMVAEPARIFEDFESAHCWASTGKSDGTETMDEGDILRAEEARGDVEYINTCSPA